MVLTHLVLNDMMKLRGEICNIIILMDDPDEKIQNLVKTFMGELYKKDPKTFYNLLPETLTRMSTPEEDVFVYDESHFLALAKNIVPFLEKDKQNENLVEKLCLRIKNSDSNLYYVYKIIQKFIIVGNYYLY